MSISLCLIIKDEEKVLDKFLKTLGNFKEISCAQKNSKDFSRDIKKYVDEIIIVDTGSKDGSKEIAKKFTSKVYSFKWCDDFSKARNFCISKASKKWILWLDPDEEISLDDLKKIRELCRDKKYLGYRFIQETVVNKKKYVCGICKLFRNNKGIKFIYPVHESVMPCIKKIGGRIGKCSIVIKHKSKYDLEKAKYYLKLIKKKAKKYPESSWEKEEVFMLDIIETFLNHI